MNSNEWNSAVNQFNSSMAGLTQTLDNMNRIEKNEKSEERQRDWVERMMKEQNEWSLNMWNKTNEYNAPSAQLQRLRDAGLNPLYYGLDGSSAQAFQSAQPLGYERAEYPNLPNPVDVATRAGLASAQSRSAEKDLELKNAQIDKLEEESTGLKLDNEFKDKTMSARAEGVALANSLTKEQIEEVRSKVKVNAEEVKKKIAETESEIERKGLILAEKTLKQAQEKEIIELLPQKKLLMEAQTMAQKAAASASYVHALYEKGLIDSGYIDNLCDDLEASIKQKNSVAASNDVIKAVNEWKLAVKNGNAYDVDSIPWTRPGDKIAAYICNELFEFTSAASEAVGGGLSGFFK